MRKGANYTFWLRQRLISPFSPFCLCIETDWYFLLKNGTQLKVLAYDAGDAQEVATLEVIFRPQNVSAQNNPISHTHIPYTRQRCNIDHCNA